VLDREPGFDAKRASVGGLAVLIVRFDSRVALEQR
jgi:hypothetical protein